MDHPCSLLLFQLLSWERNSPFSPGQQVPLRADPQLGGEHFPLAPVVPNSGGSCVSERSTCTVPPAPAFLMWEMGTVAAVQSQRHF